MTDEPEDRVGTEPPPETGFIPSGEQGIWRSLLIPFLAFVTALTIGAIIIIVSDPDVLDAFGSARFFTEAGRAVADAYRGLFTGSLGSPIRIFDAVRSGDADLLVGAFRPISETVVQATPLIFAGLAVAIGFRAGLFNIGAEGQLNAGAITAAFVGFAIEGLPIAVHLPLAVIAGFVGGAVWGAIPGILKARTGAHEVIVTIMMNFIALRTLDYLLRGAVFQRPDRPDPISKMVEPSAELPGLLGSRLRIHAGIILALLAAYGVWWLLFRTTKGFELRTVGSNPDAARYAGMSVGRTYVVVMALAGGLAGLGGAGQVLGVTKFLTPGFASGIGFEAIALALLGRAHPAGVVGAAFLFGMLRAGSTQMQALTATPVDIIVVIQALIIAFIAAPALVRGLYRIRVKRELGGEIFTKGWSG